MINDVEVCDKPCCRECAVCGTSLPASTHFSQDVRTVKSSTVNRLLYIGNWFWNLLSKQITQTLVFHKPEDENRPFGTNPGLHTP